MKWVLFIVLFFSIPLYAQLPTEKVWLQTYKDTYSVGDTLDFEASVMSYDSVVSRVVYVELFSANGHLLQERTLKTNESHTTAYYFVIDYSFKSDIYTLRAYTQYLVGFGKNTFTEKKIQITHNQDIKLQKFTPKIDIEGGALIESLPSRLAIFTASPMQSGTIIADDGGVFANFMTDVNGLALMPIVCIPNRRYRVIIGECSLQLPFVKISGATLRIDQKDSLIVVKSYTKDLKTDSLTLVVVQQGVIVFAQKISLQAVIRYNFVQTALPKGLLSFVIIDNEGQKLTERLWLNGEVTSLKNRYDCLDFYLDKPTLPNTIASQTLNQFLVMCHLKKWGSVIEFIKEQSLVREGVAKDLQGNTLKNQDLLAISSSKIFGVRTFITDSTGHFWIDGIDIEGNIELKIQTANEQLVNVNWLPRQSPPFALTDELPAITQNIVTGWDSPIAKQLEEVVVKAKYSRDKEFETVRKHLALTYHPEYVIEKEKLFQFDNLETILRANITGIRFKKLPTGEVATFIRGDLAQIFIDGIKVSDITSAPVIINIERIEITKSLAASILMHGSLVSIFTKSVYQSHTRSKSFTGNTFLRGFDVISIK
jgi:hypothetical protein